MTNIMELGVGARHVPITSFSMRVLWWNLEWHSEFVGNA